MPPKPSIYTSVAEACTQAVGAGISSHVRLTGPHPLTRRNGLVKFVHLHFTVVRNVLRNNYQSRNLIGHYPFWVISPRNSTSFTRPFLAGRRAREGHETKYTLWSHSALYYRLPIPSQGRQVSLTAIPIIEFY